MQFRFDDRVILQACVQYGGKVYFTARADDRSVVTMGYFSWRRRQRACATGVASCRRLHLAHTTEDSVGAGNGGADALAAQQVPDKVALATAAVRAGWWRRTSRTAVGFLRRLHFIRDEGT